MLSTQEDSSYFDSSHLAAVPQKYTGPSGCAQSHIQHSSRVEELKKQMAQIEKEKRAKEIKMAE